MTQEVIVQFVWPQDDEGDYLAFRRMSEKEIIEVEGLLTQAEDKGRIRPGWYVGPLGMSNDPHELFIRELRSSLSLRCCCVPTLNEAHPDCPYHGFEG